MLNLSPNGCSVRVTNQAELALTPTAVALGKFDGVHRGHQQVIKPISSSTEMGLNLSSRELEQGNIHSTVVTFDPHPQEFFSGKPRTLLTPLNEKVKQLQLLGVEQLVLLPFDRELCELSPVEFVEKILVQQLQATQISVGQDFRFGSKRSGTAYDLQIIAARYNIPVTIVSLEIDTQHDSTAQNTTPEMTRISTSLIRSILEEGNVERAQQLLGRPYTLHGVVVKGQQLGRTIGFPTANLELPKDKFLPSNGVYAVRIFEASGASELLEFLALGVMNIGNRPTVNGENVTIEVHLFDWAADLYGKKLVVELEKFLRPETKFASLEALKNQIQLDCSLAKAFFS
ncbi:bifunctional riboflavin kinase/FAD synthetase [Dulcicalothrix desertica]|uniref:bifunctional riboflavin kinase/FAD synthetase n=1 Tax=Dulcicalothrix desertica TaxID=32056 RepID=UPI0016457DE1|nr:bifunctional riboflavin kinase/FAD synthetase [Dulcicalothrix desertica]